MATWSSNVLLGVCDAPCSELVLSPYENKIGGYPDFYPSSVLPSLPHCGSCDGLLQLLVQVYCPLEGSANHRLIHLYCCTAPRCSESSKGWLALRSELKDPTLTATSLASTNTTPGSTTSSSDQLLSTGDLNEWCVGADDWGEAGIEKPDGENDNEFERNINSKEIQHIHNLEDFGVELKTEVDLSSKGFVNVHKIDNFHVSDLTQTIESLNLSSLQHAQPPLKGPHFKSFYLNVLSEPPSEHGDSQQAEKLLQQYRLQNQENEPMDHLEKLNSYDSQARCQSGSKAERTGGESYEKAVAKHGDKTFEKFKKALSRCPNQILRYNWNGKPLLITDKQHAPQDGEVTCKSCDAPAAFEFQLMPPLVYILQQINADKTRENVEFGTVLVYSCSESCWSDKEGGFRQEIVFVESDPETHTINTLSM